MMQAHPDMSLSSDAHLTRQAQEINLAYAALKKLPENHPSANQKTKKSGAPGREHVDAWNAPVNIHAYRERESFITPKILREASWEISVLHGENISGPQTRIFRCSFSASTGAAKVSWMRQTPCSVRSPLQPCAGTCRRNLPICWHSSLWTVLLCSMNLPGK